MSRISLTYLWPLFFSILFFRNLYAQSDLNEVSEAEINEIFLSVPHKSNINYRLEAFSSYFKNKELPYFSGPEGEGKDGDYDQKPISNWSRFDCVTYVESVLSLALMQKRFPTAKQNLDNYYDHLIQIKYFDEKISYINRNHFTELDWLPYLNNIKILKDVTKSVFKYAPTRTKIIDKNLWFMNKTINDLFYRETTSDEFKLQKLHELQDEVSQLNIKPVNVSLRYIPFAELKKTEIQRRLPKVSIFSLVRGEHPSKKIPTMISHQGFLIKLSPGHIVIRHASTSTLQVVDVDFNEYIEKRMQDSWPSLGLNLQIVRN